MKPFLDYDYEQNKLFEEQYSKFEEKMCMSRKERIEMERMDFRKNLYANVSWSLMSHQKA